MRKYNGNLQRVSKPTAKKLFDAGKDVLLIPCNLHPENKFYNMGFWVNKYTHDEHIAFSALSNTFAFYNCNSEAGRYLAYYVKSGAVV